MKGVIEIALLTFDVAVWLYLLSVMARFAG
jgi:hypothetical protein